MIRAEEVARISYIASILCHPSGKAVHAVKKGSEPQNYTALIFLSRLAHPELKKCINVCCANVVDL